MYIYVFFYTINDLKGTKNAETNACYQAREVAIAKIVYRL